MGSRSSAQILPDSTLGAENSTVTPNLNINGIASDRIDGGAIRGANLFHSFQELNIPEGRGAYFSNPAGIANILTRVTGRNPSDIQGTLGVLGNANLFLINPNGIRFGPKARLDLRGSFFASSASSLLFDNGFEFSAANPEAPPLLAVNIPIGLRFRSPAAAINVTGTGHALTIADPVFAAIAGAGSGSEGLRVSPGQTLALVGGDVAITGGILAAPGGRIEVGSVEQGSVSIIPTASGWNLGYADVPNFGNIQLLSLAALDASAEGSGSIQLYSQNLQVRDGSVILTQNTGALPSGSIHINASAGVQVSGTSPDASIRSAVRSETLGVGSGGDIDIQSRQLLVDGGGEISAVTFNAGQAGNLSANVSEQVQVSGSSSVKPSFASAIRSLTADSGNAGSVTISTGELSIQGGANVTSPTFGSGSAGELSVFADAIAVMGVEPRTSVQSALGASSFNTGDASSLRIDTRELVIREGGRVGAASFASGKAGNTLVNATESIEVSGTVPGGKNPSILFSSAAIVNENLQKLYRVPGVLSANSGEVTINAPVLSVRDGGRVTVINEGLGNAGTLKVNANAILLENLGGITAVTTSGSGGNIELNVRTLQLNNGTINASTLGSGKGGDITIRASESADVSGGGLTQLLELRDRAISGAIGLSEFNFGIVSGTNSSGAAGNIRIDTPRLTLRNGALIAAPTFGVGTAGNLFVRASESVEVNTSLVLASTFGSGAGGNIDVDTRRFTARNGGQFTATTFSSGEAGNIAVRASESIELSDRSADNELLSGFVAEVGQNATGRGGTLNVETRRLRVADGARISASTNGIGDGGDLIVRASEEVELIGESANSLSASGPPTDAFISFLMAEARDKGNAGNLSIETGRLRVLNGAQVSTATVGSGNGANLTVRASEFVEMMGTDRNGAPTSLYSDSLGSGKGGNVRIEAPRIVVRDGGQISAGTFFSAEGGSVTLISSDSIEVSGSVPEIRNRPFFRDESGERFPSGIYASAPESGNAGALTLQARRLLVAEGGVVSVSSDNAGEAGNLNVSVNSLRLNGGIFSAETVRGDRANITLNATDIQLRGGSRITTNSTGAATGGNITINTQTLAALENSDISANSVATRGGQVRINASGVFGTEFRQQPTSNSDITATSDLGASFSGTVQISTPNVDPSSGLVVLSQTVVDVTALVGQDPCNRAAESEFVVTGKGGLPPKPDDPIFPSAVVVEWASGDGEGIGQRASGIEDGKQNARESIPPSVVPAQGWAFNDKGEVVLTAYDASGTTPQRPYPAPPTCQKKQK